jgi:hypothetical protein
MKTSQAICNLTLTLAVSGCATVRWQAAHRGRDEAKKELQSGVMALEICGLALGPPTPSEKYLSKRGVQIRLVGGCMPSDETIGHAEGFNQVMTDGIKKKLGSDILSCAGYEN